MQHKRARRARRLGILCAIIVACGGQAAWCAVPLQTVALSGQQAPDAPAGVQFSSRAAYPFFSLNLGDSGHVAFSTTLEGPGTAFSSSAVYAGKPGNLRLAARQGDAAPGTNSTFSTFGFVYPGPSGHAAFAVPVFTTTPGAIPGGIWTVTTPGSPTSIAITGQDAPGTPAGVRWDQRDNNFNFGPPAYGADGRLLFTSSLAGPGVDSTNNYGYWASTPEGVVKAARTGDPAPGTDGLLASLNQRTLNPSGNVTFQAGLVRAGAVTTANDTGLWTGQPGALVPLAREGDPAPDAAGASWADFTSVRASQNNAGQHAFVAGLSGPGVDSTNGIGIWSGAVGELRKVIRAGDPAPLLEAGVTVAGVARHPLVNARGQVLVDVTLAGAGTRPANREALYVYDSGAFELVARKGGAVPGAAEGTTFASFNNAMINAQGDVLLLAYLAGSTVNTMGVFCHIAGQSELVPLALAGESIEVAPGDPRTIVSFAPMFDSGLEDGLPSSFNDARQFAFVANFSDGTQGVFVGAVPVPEPSCVAAVLGLALLLRRNRQRP